MSQYSTDEVSPRIKPNQSDSSTSLEDSRSFMQQSSSTSIEHSSSFVTTFSRSFAHHLLSRPIKSVLQIADHLTPGDLPEVEIIDPPKDNSSIAAQSGAIGAKMVHFALLSRMMGPRLGNGLSAYGIHPASLLANGIRLGAMGFVDSLLLEPVDTEQSYWSTKFKKTGVSFGTFATLGLAAHALRPVLSGATLAGSVARGATAGGAAGLVNAQLSAQAFYKRAATGSELASAVTNYAVFGGAFSALEFGLSSLRGYGAKPATSAFDDYKNDGNRQLHIERDAAGELSRVRIETGRVRYDIQKDGKGGWLKTVQVGTDPPSTSTPDSPAGISSVSEVNEGVKVHFNSCTYPETYFSNGASGRWLPDAELQFNSRGTLVNQWGETADPAYAGSRPLDRFTTKASSGDSIVTLRRDIAGQLDAVSIETLNEQFGGKIHYLRTPNSWAEAELRWRRLSPKFFHHEIPGVRELPGGGIEVTKRLHQPNTYRPDVGSDHRLLDQNGNLLWRVVEDSSGRFFEFFSRGMKH